MLKLLETSYLWIFSGRWAGVTEVAVYLGVYAEIHSTNEDVLELVDHWAVTDKTSYHHFLVMSCWQHAIACFFFFFHI